jgi:hypothetical protein
LQNQKFIKVVKNNDTATYINIDHVAMFYVGKDEGTTIVNFKNGERMLIKEQVDLFADRLSV